MTLVSKQQALQRWDLLPDNLKESLCSEANADFLWETCAKENIPEEMRYTVSRVAGYVLMGFIHPEDVAQELTESLKIDQRTAKLVQDALVNRIFAPIRAEVDKVYAPLSKAELPSSGIAGPKIIQDISMTMSGMPQTKTSTIKAGSAPATPVAPQKPAPLPEVGWSKMSSAGPKVSLSSISGIVPPPAVPRPTIATATTAPVAPVAPAKPSEPAPVILHEDTTFQAAAKNASFTLTKPTAGADMHIGSAPAAAPAPARPAVIEFGGVSKPPAVPNKTAAAQGGAVHYTDFKVSLSTVPTADSGPRSVSQITASTAPTAGPAIPVPVPMPPKPQEQAKPTAQSGKPIVKDFL